MPDLLPPQAIREFQELYKTELGEELSFDASKQKAEDFIQLFDLVTTPNENQNDRQFYANTK